MRDSKPGKTIEEAIIDLYLSLKIKKCESNSPEREKLRITSPFIILDYIKASIDIIVNLRLQEKLSEKTKVSKEDSENVNDYEKLLKHAEGENRNHIKIEQQLKLHSENLQLKIDDLEKTKEDLKKKLSAFTDQNPLKSSRKSNEFEQKEEENQALQKEISNLKQILKSYEDHNLKMTELEKKIRNSNVKHEKELKQVEEKYKEKIKSLETKEREFERNSNTARVFNSYQVKSDKESSDDAMSKMNACPFDRKSVQPSKHKENIKIKDNKEYFSAEKSLEKDRKSNPEFINNKISEYKKNLDKKINEEIKKPFTTAEIIDNETISDSTMVKKSTYQSSSRQKSDSMSKNENFSKTVYNKSNKQSSVERDKGISMSASYNSNSIKKVNKLNKYDQIYKEIKEKDTMQNHQNHLKDSYNNINIYSGNTKEVNLKHYIINKISNNQTKPKAKLNNTGKTNNDSMQQVRSSSTNSNIH